MEFSGRRHRDVHGAAVGDRCPSARGRKPHDGALQRLAEEDLPFLDAKRAADTGMYCDEVDFDFSKVDPEVKAKLDRLTAGSTWTEEGPPA